MGLGQQRRYAVVIAWRMPMADAFTPETLLDTAAAAKRLGVCPSFLAKARMQGVGPSYCKFGKVVRYTPANLDRYQLEHSRTSTAEEPPVTGQGVGRGRAAVKAFDRC
jgi:hypothetical protein